MVQTNILSDLVRNKAQVLMQLRQEKERQRMDQQQVLQQFAQMIPQVIKQKQDAEKERLQWEAKQKQAESEQAWKLDERDYSRGREQILDQRVMEQDKNNRMMDTFNREVEGKEKVWGDLERHAKEGIAPPEWVSQSDPDRANILNQYATEAKSRKEREEMLADLDWQIKNTGLPVAQAQAKIKQWEADQLGKRRPDTRPLHEVEKDFDEGLERQTRIDKMKQDMANNDLPDSEKLATIQDFERELVDLKGRAAQESPTKVLGDAQRFGAALESLLTAKIQTGLGESVPMFAEGTPLYDMVEKLIQTIGDITQKQLDRIQSGGR